MLLDLLINTIASPAALTAIVLAVRGGTGVAVAAGYLGAHWMIAGAPSLVPTSAVGWLPHAAVFAAIASLIEGPRIPRHFAWIGRCAMAVALAWFVLRAARLYQWGTVQGLMWTAGFAVALVASLWSLREVANQHDRRATLLYYGLLAAGGAITLVFSATVIVAQLEGGLAAAIGVAFLATVVWGARFDPRAAATPVATLLWAMWAIGFLYAEMPAAALMLLLSTPAVLLLVHRLVAKRGRPALALIVHITAASLPAAGAAAVAAAHYFDDSGSSNGEFDYGYDFDSEVD